MLALVLHSAFGFLAAISAPYAAGGTLPFFGVLFLLPALRKYQRIVDACAELGLHYCAASMCADKRFDTHGRSQIAHFYNPCF